MFILLPFECSVSPSVTFAGDSSANRYSIVFRILKTWPDQEGRENIVTNPSGKSVEPLRDEVEKI